MNIDKLIAYENGELDQEQTISFFQELIDSGKAYSLQGSYGRMAERLIEAGYCHRPTPECYDTNGVKLERGQTVDMPAPDYDDCYQYEFQGTITGFRNGYAQVEDQDGDTFDIEPERVTVVEE